MSTIAEVKAAWKDLEGGEGSDDWGHRFRILGLLIGALTEPTAITPEQQAVLDAAVNWHERIGFSRSMADAQYRLAAAVDAYTATLRKPSVADRLEAVMEQWRNRLHDAGPDIHKELRAIIAEVRELEAGK